MKDKDGGSQWPPRTIPAAVSLRGEGEEEEEANLYHLAIVAVVVAEKKAKKTNWQSLWAHRLSLSESAIKKSTARIGSAFSLSVCALVLQAHKHTHTNGHHMGRVLMDRSSSRSSIDAGRKKANNW